MSDNNNYTSPASSNKPQEDTNNHKPIGSSSKSFRSLACQRIGCLMSSNALKQQQPRLDNKSSSKNSLMGMPSSKDTNNFHKFSVSKNRMFDELQCATTTHVSFRVQK